VEWHRCLAGLTLAALAALPGAARAADDPDALAALTAQAAIERKWLEAERTRLREAAADFLGAQKRLADRVTAVNPDIPNPEAPGPAPAEPPSPARTSGDLDRAVEDAALAQAAASEAFSRWQESAGALREGLRRLGLIEERIAALKVAHPREQEPLTGTWDVALLPSGDRGTFILKQTGTLVTGQYTLQGGWKGSLQGTIVSGKIYLQRIDSKLGRSSELDGFLEAGGTTIRGSWQNYSLADGSAASGAWTATRRKD